MAGVSTTAYAPVQNALDPLLRSGAGLNNYWLDGLELFDEGSTISAGLPHLKHLISDFGESNSVSQLFDLGQEYTSELPNVIACRRDGRAENPRTLILRIRSKHEVLEVIEYPQVCDVLLRLGVIEEELTEFYGPLPDL
jgi:hypothetical protein